MSPNGRTMAHGGTRLERVGMVASRAASLRPADSNLRRALYVVLGLVVALSIALAAWSSFGELPGLDWHFRPGWIAAAAASMSALVLINAELWRRLLNALGQELPRRRGMAIWCVSALGRYVPTSLMMPVMRAAMAEREGVPKRVTLASVVYELALAFTGVLIAGAYFIIDTPQLNGHPERFAVLALPILALIVLQPRIFHRAADFALVRLGRQRLPISLSASKVFLFAAAYSLIPILGGICVYALAQSIYPASSEDAVVVLGAFALGTALSLVAFILPSGLVAREAGLTVALAPAIPAAPAVAIAVLLRIVQLAVELGLAATTSLLARSRGRSPALTPNA